MFMKYWTIQILRSCNGYRGEYPVSSICTITSCCWRLGLLKAVGSFYCVFM